MTQEEMKKVLEIGVMLSAERDPLRLLDRILGSVMDLAHCDAGTLYTLEDRALRFRIMRTDSRGVHTGADGVLPDIPPVPLDKRNICAFSFLERKTVNIPDVYECADYDFTGPKEYDRMTGYRTCSMLAVPMADRKGNGIGVIQLINAMDADGNVRAFRDDMVLVLESVASQAAITIQNVRYMNDIKGLFDSFVKVMSSAIDERTPYNANHSRRMAECGAAFIDHLNAIAEEAGGSARFTAEQKEEFVMSVWLHDVGKLVTPLEVMNKASRLLPEQSLEIRHRMREILLTGLAEKEAGRITEGQYEDLKGRTEAAAQLIRKADTAGFVTDDMLEKLNELAAEIYTDIDGNTQPWLTPDELAMLSIRKGTLSESERAVMEEHVKVTDRLLSQIRFSPELSHVRQWAASHHEFLDGSGYPRHIGGGEIPYEVRIITILDIFDALVADDRPYKPGLPVEKALGILTSMAEKEGKLDPVLTRQFIDSRCWEAAGYAGLDAKG